ncbi:uncharacterized protein VTP21DRAFT_9196 [Calcarisporiella thermophila]|uniref:uncharacterized protein n=1 Tax=Calcarisporiella thermophila TaxID=911321 RepID=UPI003743E62C
MPAKIRLTLVSNCNQTIRTVVIVESPDPLDDDQNVSVIQFHTKILELAKRKFRLKKPTRIFESTGKELFDTMDRNAYTEGLHDDCVLLISCGENFIGPSKTASTSTTHAPNLSQPVDLRILAKEVEIDPVALQQLESTAQLPGVRLALGMPDLHPGNSHPIGAVFGTQSIIYPALVGGDIGCGMALFYCTTIPATVKPSTLAQRLVGLERPWEGNTSQWLAQRNIETTPFDGSLGTIGAGNHFAEFLAVESIQDQEAWSDWAEVDQDHLFLLVHSGSRGYGKSILEAHTAPHGTKGLSVGSEEFDAYMKLHDHACMWAKANRDLIAHRIFSLLQVESSDAVTPKLLDLWHNNIVRKTVSLDSSTDPTSDSESSELWLHRKGAAPSDMGFMVIPGSRGSYSYLVKSRGNQSHNGYSVAHGAGRRLTRSKASSRLKEKYRANVDHLKTTPLGSTVICEDRELLLEEAPEAYKSIDTVISDLVDLGIISVVATFRPVITYKYRRD